MDPAYFIGVDIGTQGVRIALVDEHANVIAGRSEQIPLTPRSREEQSPEQWWQITHRLLQEIVSGLSEQERKRIRAIAADSTSGTVIPLDRQNRPLHDALMYSDPRSAAEGQFCRHLAEKHCPDGYTGFNASSGLSKMIWFINNYPEKAAGIGTWIHASDYITGMLSGNFRTTDYTNALKSGYDVATYKWPEYLVRELPIRRDWLQEVVPSGTPVGSLLPEIGAVYGLGNVQVVAGMTDGCASQIAAGAVSPGSWNTTIGTTLVIKGVTTKEVRDPEGRVYSHRHPDGYWMPGGASNTGADWVNTGFSEHLEHFNRTASSLMPTGKAAWPLLQEGERFPFVSPAAKGFAPHGLSKEVLYTAYMEGVAYIERMAYELIESLSGEKAAAIYTAGGGSNSDVWLRIRSCVLNKPIHKCLESSGAVGAAIAAASGTYFSSIAEAARTMTKIEKTIWPEQDLVERYNFGYQDFLDELKKRKYI